MLMQCLRIVGARTHAARARNEAASVDAKRREDRDDLDARNA